MKSTREKILRTLLAYPKSTINDLAEAVGINGISVRHHLTALEAEAMVTSTEERHGVGRPRLIYSLTDKGIEAFPTSYLRLIRRILNNLHNKLSPTEFETLFEDIGADIARPYEEDLEGKTLDKRIMVLEKILINEGFIVEITKNEKSYTLTTLSCPYFQVGIEHPVICSLDQTLITTILGAIINVESCINDGSDRCTYQIQAKQ